MKKIKTGEESAAASADSRELVPHASASVRFSSRRQASAAPTVPQAAAAAADDGSTEIVSAEMVDGLLAAMGSSNNQPMLDFIASVLKIQPPAIFKLESIREETYYFDITDSIGLGQKGKATVPDSEVTLYDYINQQTGGAAFGSLSEFGIAVNGIAYVPEFNFLKNYNMQDSFQKLVNHLSF